MTLKCSETLCILPTDIRPVRRNTALFKTNEWNEKGKPSVRVGRKASGTLSQLRSAGPPNQDR